MEDAMQLTFSVPCPENILWWIICLAFTGTLITGVMMLQAGRFTKTTAGAPVSTQKFHLVGSAGKAVSILGSMSPASRASMRRGVRIDFCYTPFFYGLMICLSILAQRNAHMGEGWNEILTALCWLPVATWAFDLLEDWAAISLLNTYEEKGEAGSITTGLMTASSGLKWLSGIVWLLVMISLAVAWAVARLT